MKKRISNRQLGRDHNARLALFKSLLSALIEHEEIKTTSAKAKTVQRIFEKIITKARLGTLHARRQLQSVLQDRVLVKKLVDDIAPRFLKVSGGYTKLTLIGNRLGDNAPTVKLSLTKKSVVSVKSTKSSFPKSSAKKTLKSLAKPPIIKEKISPPSPSRTSQPVSTPNLVGTKSTIGIKKGER